jgi:hypothetical protein
MLMDNGVKSETAKLRADIDSPETAAGLQQYDDLQVMRDKVNAYAGEIKNAKEAYNSQPVITREYYEAIDESLATVGAELTANPETGQIVSSVINEMEYEGGKFTFPVTIVTTDGFTQKFPAEVVDYLFNKHGDLFANVEYEGYTVDAIAASEENPEAAGFQVSFDLTLTVNNEKQLADITKEAKEAAEAAAAEEAAAADAAQSDTAAAE